MPEHLAKFPYVNGSIFADQMRTEYFAPEMRDALLNACRFHWSHISPAVFGSMFHLVKSKEARRNDGEHYTSETNILKTIEPLFLDELRAEADRLISAKSTPVKKLREFRDSLADMILVDPAFMRKPGAAHDRNPDHCGDPTPRRPNRDGIGRVLGAEAVDRPVLRV